MDKTDCVPLSQHVCIRTDFLRAEPEMGTFVKVFSEEENVMG